MSNNSDFDVDDLLDSLFPKESLLGLFEKRVEELGITPTNALEVIDIEYRALYGILNGTSPRVDARNFSKIASFLGLSREYVIKLFFDVLDKTYLDRSNFPEKNINFIKKNFDLAALKKVGFIEDLSDYFSIEEKIRKYFGYKTIFEFAPPKGGIAFSAGIRKPKNNHAKNFWLVSAKYTFINLNNSYEYSRDELINYFPKIRRQSIDVENGLINVIKDLYKLGVSVIYQSSLPSIHLKGATMVVNNKPCVVLTNYMGYYTTIWHTLCHELFHVLFDLEEISENGYHISEEENDELPVKEREKEADYFAKEFLFSSDKLEEVKPHINNREFVKKIANRFQVPESFIYTYFAFEYGKNYPGIWAKVKANDPSFIQFLKRIENPWENSKEILEFVNNLKKSGVYN